MKRFLLCFFLFGLFSCSFDSEYLPDASSEVVDVEVISETTIPKEEALQELKNLLSSWSSDGLRSEGQGFAYKRMLADLENYNLSKIKTVPGGGNSLRAEGDTIERNENLLHLVNFDEGGYAVLSADKRIPATVLAIVENGDVDINDFIIQDSLLTEKKMQELDSNFKFYNDSVKDSYVASRRDDHLTVNEMIYSYARAYADFPCDNGLNNGDNEESNRRKYVDRMIDYDCGGGGGATPVYERVVGDWKTLEEVPTLVKTKWGQSYPFDKYSPKRWKYAFFGPSRRAPAGCVPIAIAQILTALKYPHHWEINGTLVDWNKLGNFRTINRWEDGTEYIDHIAGSVLRFIGLSVDAWYFYNATFAFPSNAKQFFKDWDFENVNRFWCGKEEHTIEALKKGAPVFISSISGWVNGHAWVIDGYRIQEREIKTVNPSTSEIVATEKENRTLVHCNFGWRGIADGYYYFGVFNTESGPVDFDKIDESRATGDSNFTWYTSVITFNNPNKR